MSATSNSTTPHNHHHHSHSQNATIPKEQEKPLPNYKHEQHQSPDITKEEFERISEALKKEEFRKLFLDYIEEIQDPENRRVYEQEIKQLEAERGVDVVFIHPQPGFVIKTSQDGSQKCFINCAKSEHVAKPTNQLCLDHKTGNRGLNWSIPMAQAPPRDDLDNKNKRCCVYDVVFHPDALYLAERNASFHKCLVETALDAVEREYKVNLDRINIKFPKMQFKGVARPTVIRKLAQGPPAECNEPHPLDEIYPAKPSANAGIPKVLPLKTLDCSNQTTKKSSDFCTPKYTFKYRHDVDLTEYTHELDAKLHVSMPRQLVVDIELPLLNSSSECQLDLTEKTLFLLSERVGAKYRLNIDLPFRVKDKEGTAKFDLDTRHLLITLPVLRPSVEKQRQMHESLLHLSREDSGVESDVREELLSSNNESLVQEICSLNMEQTLNKASEATTLSDAESEQHFLNTEIDYQLPNKFDCNVLDNTMSWVLHVRNVQEDSLQIKRIDNTLHLKFISLGSGYYPTHYSFYIKLSPEEKEAKILDADAEAWENNVIFNLHLSKSAEGIASYLAGIDSVNLQEYEIQEKLKVAHNSRQRLKDDDQSCLDISIERSECEKTIEIEIKSRKNELSTCNANTTEDEDINSAGTDTLTSQQQQQKKLGKKQKRKNKKRRSLSESACDDIKAYQQQQQQQHQQQQNLITTNPVAELNENVREENAADADDDDDEDSSPDRTEKSLKSLHTASLSMKVPSKKGGINNSLNSDLNLQQRKQRSFSESRDSAISLSVGSSSYKGILKHYSRYDPRPSISDSCDSIDDFSSSAYSTSVDGLTSTFHSLRFAHSFSDIPEENVVGLSESCKKTVRFSEVIKKQVFRMDSSILGQRKKNQKRRDRKQRALQRRLSEGDSADYEDKTMVVSLTTPTPNNQYLKSKTEQDYATKIINSNKHETMDKKSNKMRARLESESSSDVDNHKNSMMFEMDM